MTFHLIKMKYLDPFKCLRGFGFIESFEIHLNNFKDVNSRVPLDKKPLLSKGGT